ncbi:hypothetical protein BLNAU_20999 [Blattamonas nauphoetae]|uniref:Uncharacterized protein n=1 Tax=Blattamonas nauphoetae TaxID=2049346 RepID=A0ABQ9WZC7_9EUKA|nr:hypothetical protein BLNAU_20999 [Blattamonas nauphoetae]
MTESNQTQPKQFPITFIPTFRRRYLTIPPEMTFEECECQIFALFDIRCSDRLIIEAESPTLARHRLTSTDTFRAVVPNSEEDSGVQFFVTTEGMRASHEGKDKLTPLAFVFPRDPERGVIAQEQIGSYASDILGGVSRFFSRQFANRSNSPSHDESNDSPSESGEDSEQAEQKCEQNPTDTVSAEEAAAEVEVGGDELQQPPQNDEPLDEQTKHAETEVVDEAINSSENTSPASPQTQNPNQPLPDIMAQFMQMLQNFNQAVAPKPHDE